MTSLENRAIAITGGAGGIARGLAEAILEAGGKVALIDLAGTKVAHVAAELDASGERVIALVGRRHRPRSLENGLCRHRRPAWVALDGLVNNAGIVRMGPADAMRRKNLDLELAVNVKGVLLASQAAARHFGKAGAIVNIASNAGKVGYRNMAGYNASKAAVINLTRSLSLEWAERGINVNAVCPGGVATDMLRSVAAFHRRRRRDRDGEPDGAPWCRTSSAATSCRSRSAGWWPSCCPTRQLIIRGQSITIDGGDTPY